MADGSQTPEQPTLTPQATEIRAAVVTFSIVTLVRVPRKASQAVLHAAFVNGAMNAIAGGDYSGGGSDGDVDGLIYPYKCLESSEVHRFEMFSLREALEARQTLDQVPLNRVPVKE